MITENGKITGIEIPRQKKTLINCPLLFTFMRPFSSEIEEDGWNDDIDVLSRQVMGTVKAGMDNDNIFKYFHKMPFDLWKSGIFRPDIRHCSPTSFSEHLFLIGWEVASVRDVYAVADDLVHRFISLGLVDPKLLTAEGGFSKISGNIEECALAGARYRESSMGIDPLLKFREIEELLPER